MKRRGFLAGLAGAPLAAKAAGHAARQPKPGKISASRYSPTEFQVALLDSRDYAETFLIGDPCTGKSVGLTMWMSMGLAKRKADGLYLTRRIVTTLDATERFRKVSPGCDTGKWDFVTFPNGSRVYIAAYFDADRYRGFQFHRVAIDDAPLEYRDYLSIIQSCRGDGAQWASAYRQRCEAPLSAGSSIPGVKSRTIFVGRNGYRVFSNG